MSSYDDDESLMRQLRDAVSATGAVTDQARSAAQAAFSWRTLDEELMRLTHDSSVSGEVLVRGAPAARMLGFVGRDLNLEIELDAGQVTGQVLPGRSCRVSVVTATGDPHSAQADESGVFTLAFENKGPVRFTVDVDGEPRRTVWVTI
ncbi:MAG: hypothetical protein ABI873_06535 [Marmoricola sp.]